MPTTTPQWIQDFDKFEDDREYHIHDVDRKDYLDFIETQIAQAEKRIKEQMTEYVDKELKLQGYEHKEILDYISSF